jgi:short-subunit dehydrogenase
MHNKTIVITGASSGIGAAAAKALAAQGARVLLIARRADELETVVTQIRDAGGSAMAYPTDLSDTKALNACAAQILAEVPCVNVLINNAGRSIRRAIVDSLDRPHDFERTIELNYLAAVRLTLKMLPNMLEQNSGQIINVSSQSTQMPMPRFAAYVASKSALEGFSHSMAAELAGTGIAVTVVNYPLVRTPMSGATKLYSKLPMMSPEQAAQWLVKAVRNRPARIATPLGRAWEMSTATLPGITTALTGRLMNYAARRLAR